MLVDQRVVYHSMLVYNPYEYNVVRLVLYFNLAIVNGGLTLPRIYGGLELRIHGKIICKWGVLRN